jgi:ATP-dependent RNA helicase DeaD
VLVNTREARRIPELERRTAVKFKRGSIPQGKDICERQLFAMVDKMVQVGVNMDEIEPYLPPVYKALGKLDKEELIRRFVSVEFNRFLDYYRNSADLNAYPPRSGKPAPKPRRLSDQDVQSLFINVGRLDNIHEGAIVRLICDKAGIRSDNIGQITLKREFSFVDVEQAGCPEGVQVPQGNAAGHPQDRDSICRPRCGKGQEETALEKEVIWMEPSEKISAPACRWTSS